MLSQAEARTRLRKAVRNGVNYLDTNHPNWFEKINTEILNLGDCYKCILGQLFGHYCESVSLLNISYKVSHYGFSIPSDEYFPGNKWNILLNYWLNAIKIKKMKTNN